MTHVHNDPHAFARQAADGFAAAFGDFVVRVPGGVIRATRPPGPEVAVVIGGGSGHYPAFAGLVGHGLAAGAAMGEVFASPSSRDVGSVARAADTGAGVLFSFGNYAGDVLNFAMAQDALRAEGVPCETVLVTDDIASAGPAHRAERRGIAGGLFVYKVAGAAASQGRPLAEVARLAARANERTRTLGVAFSGCTLPGAGRPLFEVEEGLMALGMGIHGEPGLSEAPKPSADGLAQLLVERLLADLPEGVAPRTSPAVVLLNGLGATKYEELFVLYGKVEALLGEAGVGIVQPEVGELVTSFAMAGLSLSLCWLDEELAPLWAAPAWAPAFRKGGGASLPGLPWAEGRLRGPAHEAEPGAGGPASALSRRYATGAASALAAAGAAVDEAVGQLGAWDAVAGDGDHGLGMQRGLSAAAAACRAAASTDAGVGTALAQAAEAWSAAAGGTSGALWGLVLSAVADVMGDEQRLTLAVIAASARHALDAVQSAAGAQPGDKTMVDAMVPFTEVLERRSADGQDLTAALEEAARAARAGAEGTASMAARKGRARAHGARSIGHPDPGAMSFVIALEAVLAPFTNRRTADEQ